MTSRETQSSFSISNKIQRKIFLQYCYRYYRYRIFITSSSIFFFFIFLFLYEIELVVSTATYLSYSLKKVYIYIHTGCFRHRALSLEYRDTSFFFIYLFNLFISYIYFYNNKYILKAPN